MTACSLSVTSFATCYRAEGWAARAWTWHEAADVRRLPADRRRAARGRPGLDRQLGRRRARGRARRIPARAGASAGAARDRARRPLSRAGAGAARRSRHPLRRLAAEPRGAARLRASSRHRARAAPPLCRSVARDSDDPRLRGARVRHPAGLGAVARRRGPVHRPDATSWSRATARRCKAICARCCTTTRSRRSSRAHGRATILARHTCAHRVDELLAIHAELAAHGRGTGEQRMTNKMSIAFFASSLVSAYWNGAATYYRGIVRALARARSPRHASTSPMRTAASSTATSPTPTGPRSSSTPAKATTARCAWSSTRAAPTWSSRRAASASSTTLLEEAVLDLQAADDACRLLGRRRAGDARPRCAPIPPIRSHALIPRYDLVLTYGGGQPVVARLRGARARRDACRSTTRSTRRRTTRVPPDPRFVADLGFLGNRLPDREARVEEFFLARRAPRCPGAGSCSAAAAGATSRCPPTSSYVGHVYTADHNAFNATPLAVLNVSRESMARYGFSPATRVFEAAGAAACLITDAWEGIELFLEPGEEVLVARDGDEVAAHLERLDSGDGTGDRRRRVPPRARRAHLRAPRGEARGAARRPCRDACACRRSGMSARFAAEPTARSDAAPRSVRFASSSSACRSRRPGATGTRRPTAASCASWSGAATTSSFSSATCRGTPRTATCRTRRTGAPRSTLISTRCAEPMRRRSAAPTLVIVGSYVPQGVAVGDWVQAEASGRTAFYDIDTPVTLAKLARDGCDYLDAKQIAALRPLSLVHRRPDAAQARARVRIACGARRSTARSIPISTTRICAGPNGTSAISAPTATTASRRSIRCS